MKFKLFTQAANRLSAAVTGLVERIGDEANSQLIATNKKDTASPGKTAFKVRCSDEHLSYVVVRLASAFV